MKFTKIIATIGPSSDSPEMIEKLLKAGVNIFRFNFKHNTVEWHDERLQRVKSVSEKIKIPVATLIDLQGPSIRTNQEAELLEIDEQEQIHFGERVFTEHLKGFSLSHPEIINELPDGQLILVNDGLYAFTFHREGDNTYLVSHTKAKLANKRNVTIPGATFSFPVLLERDFEGLHLASRAKIDFVALSFVRSAHDIKTLRAEMEKYKVEAKVVAKIETQIALNHLDAILSETDSIMIARGDLGVELPLEQVPYYQRLMIGKCIERGIPVITATQMLQSMVDNPIPTRAEVSDVAHAVYECTDSVMLSGETASGKYPLETVNVMHKTVAYNEHKQLIEDNRKQFNYITTEQEEIIADTAYNLYLRSLRQHSDIQGFILFTLSGRTARLISRYRPTVPIFAFTPNQHVANSLLINFGVIPIIHAQLGKEEVTKDEIFKAIEILKENNHLKKGGSYILLHGDYWMVKGGTSTIKLISI